MKKVLIICLGICLQVLCFYPAEAAVTGDCANCHTMHNSQDGQSMTFNLDVTGASGPVTALLKSNCIGCHTNASNSSTIVDLGTGNKSRVPIVFNPGGGLQYPANGSANSSLAAGNFFWVTEGDSYGHNVRGIVAYDQTLHNAPGQNDYGMCSRCHKALSDGCESCHTPAHHYDDGIDGPAGQGDGWYRFLGSRYAAFYANFDNKVTLESKAPKGIEDPNWEQNPSPSQHNVYLGYPDSTTNPDLRYSTNRKCRGCHMKFHRDIDGDNNTWIRHPADVVIPSTGEYAGYTAYDPLVPVAVPDLAVGVQATVRPGTDLVSCLSCHRAHASPYPDMLRWDYTNECLANSSSAKCGCFTCHTAKDGVPLP